MLYTEKEKDEIERVKEVFAAGVWTMLLRMFCI